jgi:hypothetical protein
VPSRERWRLATALAVAVTLSMAGCGGSVRRAPNATELPLLSHAQVVASAAGGSDVDSASDPDKYRYMTVCGPAGISSTVFLAREVQLLMHDGWNHEQSWTIPLRSSSGTPELAPLTSPGATVQLDSPHHQIYLSANVIVNRDNAAEATSGTPFQSPTSAMLRALRKHDPILWIQLGNGSAQPVK